MVRGDSCLTAPVGFGRPGVPLTGMPREVAPVEGRANNDPSLQEVKCIPTQPTMSIRQGDISIVKEVKSAAPPRFSEESLEPGGFELVLPGLAKCRGNVPADNHFGDFRVVPPHRRG